MTPKTRLTTLLLLLAPYVLAFHSATGEWNAAYAELTGAYAFAPKPVLIALSRAGLYCYNWAAANPDKVACIYGDAPVCALLIHDAPAYAMPGNTAGIGTFATLPELRACVLSSS